MAEMARGGALGQLVMVHTWHYTDWMYRPRLPPELDVAQGGGPVFRQASHQVDIVRYIAGGRVRSVRAMTVQLDPARGAEGAYTVYLEFDNDVPATIVYSGYGHFDLAAMLRGRETNDRPPARAAGPPAPHGRQAEATSMAEDEAARKNAMRYGAGGSRGANTLGLFGFTVVTCERGDLRESPDGLYLYQQGSRTTIAVEDELRGAAELEELYHAVRHDRPMVHDGRWGEATLEVCLAIHESARTRQEVKLTRQTAVPTPFG
jgi:phthalate 4,5-cis-dihydrodiol dehydrogenase